MKKIMITGIIFLGGYVNINVAADVPSQKVFTIKGINGAAIQLSEEVTKSVPFLEEQIKVKDPNVCALSFDHDQKGLDFLGGYATQRYVFKKTNLAKIANHLEDTIGKLSLGDLGYFTEVIEMAGYDKGRIPEGFQIAWIMRVNDGITGMGQVEQVIGDPSLVKKIYKDCWQDNFASKLKQESNGIDQARELSQSKLVDLLSQSEQNLIAEGQNFFKNLNQTIYLDQKELKAQQVVVVKQQTVTPPSQQHQLMSSVSNKFNAILKVARNFWERWSAVQKWTSAGISFLAAFVVYKMLPEREGGADRDIRYAA